MEKKIFRFGCGVFFGLGHNGDIFSSLRPSLPGPGCQHNGPIFGSNFFGI